MRINRHMGAWNMVLAGGLIILLSCNIIFPVCSVSAYTEEGLSDEQLYGNGEENVLGNKARSRTAEAAEKKRKDTSVKASQDTNPEEKKSESYDKPEESENADIASEEAAVNKSASGEADTSEETDISSDSNNSANETVIEVTGVEDKKYYNSAVQVGVKIDSINENTKAEACIVNEKDGVSRFIGLTPVGEVLEGEEEVTEEGNYSVSVVVADDSKEEIKKELSFCMDKTAPVIDKELCRELCASEINVDEIKEKVVFDESPVKVSVSINQQEVDKGIVKQSGDYDIAVSATDEAGNSSDEEVSVTLGNSEADNNKSAQKRMLYPLSGIIILAGSTLYYQEKRKEKKREEEENEKTKK